MGEGPGEGPLAGLVTKKSLHRPPPENQKALIR
jgi:hypothetical protein